MAMKFDYLGNLVEEEGLGPLIASNDPNFEVSSEQPSLMPKAKNIMQETPRSSPEPMNPMLKEYLMPKLNLAGYEDADRKKLMDGNKADFGDKFQAALAAAGAGFMGKDAGAAGNAVLSRQKGERDSKLSEFDKARAGKIQQYGLDREVMKNDKDDETLKRESAVDSEESKLAQGLASKVLPGKDFSQMSAAQINKLMPSLTKIYDIEQQKLNRQDARDERRMLFGDKMNEKQRLLDEKRNDRDLKLAVPGFERTGEVLPKEEEAQKFRKATAVSEQLKTKLNRLRDLVGGNPDKGVKGVGSYEYGGTTGTEMESLATEIQLLGKSPELYELGVLAGPDLNLLEKITADPSSLSSMFTSDKSRLKQIDSQLSSISGKLDSTAKSMGYRPAGDGAKPETKVVGGKTYRKVQGGWEELTAIGQR